MTDVIDRFVWPWDVLSNFHQSPLIYQGITYPTVEHAFQAAKTHERFLREQIAEAKTPSVAKQLGRQVKLRGDWEDVKDSVMEELLTIKFSEIEPAMLLNTSGDSLLVEGNNWHDQYWGDCRCGQHIGVTGLNRLGELLMVVRSRNRETINQ